MSRAQRIQPAREEVVAAVADGQWPSHSVTTCVRAAHLALGLLALLDPPAVNARLATVWAGVRGCRAAHHFMFEALLATCAFGLWIALYKLADRTRLSAFRFASAAPARQGVPLWNSWRIGVAYLAAVYLFHGFRTKPPLDLAPPSARRLGEELLCGIVAYDMLEWGVHLLLHRCGTLQGLHRKHHAQVRLCAPEVLNHGALDAFQQVALNVLVQQLSPWGVKHSLSRMLHNVCITYMLTEIHAGYDAPWCMHNVWPAVCGGAKRHEVHHRDGSVYYAEFFKGLDDLLGFVERPARSQKGVLMGRSST